MVRHCGPKRLDEDNRPTAEAFYREEGDDSISVNWLEKTGAGTLDDRVDVVRAALSKKRAVRRSHRFAMLNVGDALAALARKKKLAIEFRHDPEPGDPSHSGIYGVGIRDHAVGIILKGAVMCVVNAMPPATPREP